MEAALSREKQSDTTKFFTGKLSWSDATVPVQGGGWAGRSTNHDWHRAHLAALSSFSSSMLLFWTWHMGGED